MEEAAVPSGHELLDLLLATVALRHLEAALLDGGHRRVHARPAHVLVAAKVVEEVTHRLLAAHRAPD